MSISELTDYFLRYGAFFIYLIVLLEYLNLPGFPAGVIMPLAGIWAAKGEISFCGTYRKLGAVSSRKIRRREGDGILF